MAVRRAQAPPVHWSLWVFATIGLCFVAAGTYSMARPRAAPARQRARQRRHAVQLTPATRSAPRAVGPRRAAAHQVYSYADPHDAPAKAYQAAVRCARARRRWAGAGAGRPAGVSRRG
jgi:hypothetical protein